VAGVRDDRLALRVQAPPLEGRANVAVERLLAGALGIARGRVTVVGGQSAREKLVRVEGLTGAEIERALAPR